MQPHIVSFRERKKKLALVSAGSVPGPRIMQESQGMRQKLSWVAVCHIQQTGLLMRLRPVDAQEGLTPLNSCVGLEPG